MHTLFKCEVFARDFTFRSFAPIESPEIRFDYLTLEKTTLRAVKLDAKKGDFISVTDQNGNVAYQGIVDDVETDKTGVTISAQPLMSLFDAEVYFDRTTSAKIEPFIASIIRDNFVYSGDALQNISGLKVDMSCDTTVAIYLKEIIHCFYEIFSIWLSSYGIAINMAFDPQNKAITVTVGKVSESAVIEASLQAIVDKNIIIGDSSGQLNKVTIYNKADETQRITYYLHPNGKVDTNNTDRITPVFFAAQFLETDINFESAAYKKAYEALSPQKYDNMIELTARNDCGVLDTSMAIGTEVLVIDGDSSYKSILTGYARSQDVTKMTFGVVRADLTKILILERRANA